MTLAMVCGMVLCAGTAYGQTPQPQPPHTHVHFAGHYGKFTYVVRAALPEEPSTVRIYRPQKIDSLKDLVLRLINALPLQLSAKDQVTLQSIKQMSESMLAPEAEFDIGGWSIGAKEYGTFSVRQEREDDRQDLHHLRPAPAPDDARKMADAFLKQTGLLPAGAQFSKVVDTRCITSGGGKGQPSQTTVILRTVSYDYGFDSIPYVTGVGVQVGPDGVVQMADTVFHVAPDQTVPILTPAECVKKLQDGECHIDKGPYWDATAYIDSMSLVYWYPSRNDERHRVVPLYVISGQAEADGYKPEPWKAYVEAVRPECLDQSEHVVWPQLH